MEKIITGNVSDHYDAYKIIRFKSYDQGVMWLDGDLALLAAGFEYPVEELRNIIENLERQVDEMADTVRQLYQTELDRVLKGKKFTFAIIGCSFSSEYLSYFNVIRRVLSDYPDIQVIDGAVTAETVPQTVEHIYNRVLRYKPDISSLFMGINDMRRNLDVYSKNNVSPQEFQRDIVTNRLLANRWDVKLSQEKYSAREILKRTWHAAGTLFMPILVLGGIYSGIFTATEAAAVACVYSLIVSFCYKSMTLKKLFEILKKSATVSAMGLLIVGSANIFGWLLTAGKIPATITAFLVPLLKNKVIYMAVLLVILFLVGALMETSASVVILAPIIVPTGIALGFDPLHLGVVFVIALVVGYITPPFGVNLFTVTSITGESYTSVVKGLIPYIICMIAAVILIAFIEPLVTFLPLL